MTNKTLDRIQKRPKMLNTYQGCGVAPPKKIKQRRRAAPAPAPALVELPRQVAVVKKQRPVAPPVPSVTALERLLRSGKLQSHTARIGSHNYNVYRVADQSLWATQPADDTGFSYRYIPSTDLVEFHPWGAAPQSLTVSASDMTGSGYVDRNYIRWGPKNDEFMLRSRQPRSGWVEVVNRYLLPDGIRIEADTRPLIVDEIEYRVSIWELKKYPKAFVNEFPTRIYGLLRPGDYAPERKVVQDLGGIMYNVYTGGADTAAFDWNDDEGFTAFDAFG
jgi:hypothetical protein